MIRSLGGWMLDRVFAVVGIMAELHRRRMHARWERQIFLAALDEEHNHGRV